MRPDIQAYKIQQPVTGALGQSDERTGKRVDFFDGQSHLDRQILHRSAQETADAIGNEVGRVLARHYALTQMPVGKIGNVIAHRGQGLRSGDHSSRCR